MGNLQFYYKRTACTWLYLHWCKFYLISAICHEFSSPFISSAESKRLSPDTQVESVLILEHFVVSFMKIKNRRGPKIDPCGTPH